MSGRSWAKRGTDGEAYAEEAIQETTPFWTTLRGGITVPLDERVDCGNVGEVKDRQHGINLQEK